MLEADGVSVHREYVGEYATSMEMAGLSISLIKLDDELAAARTAAETVDPDEFARGSA